VCVCVCVCVPAAAHASRGGGSAGWLEIFSRRRERDRLVVSLLPPNIPNVRHGPDLLPSPVSQKQGLLINSRLSTSAISRSVLLLAPLSSLIFYLFIFVCVCVYVCVCVSANNVREGERERKREREREGERELVCQVGNGIRAELHSFRMYVHTYTRARTRTGKKKYIYIYIYIYIHTHIHNWRGLHLISKSIRLNEKTFARSACRGGMQLPDTRNCGVFLPRRVRGNWFAFSLIVRTTKCTSAICDVQDQGIFAFERMLFELSFRDGGQDN